MSLYRGEFGSQDSGSRDPSYIEDRADTPQDDDHNLTDLNAPSPVTEKQRGRSLEGAEEREQRHNSSEDNDEFLTSVAAPKPVQNVSERSPKRQPDGLTKKPDDNEVERDSSSQEKDAEKQEPQKPESSRRERYWREAVTIGWLCFFSIWGTLARLGTEAITIYPYAVTTTTVLWANLGGSFFMGFLLQDRRLFRYAVQDHHLTEDEDKNNEHIDNKKKIAPLYIGLGTGFCGSFTSFSSLVQEMFEATTNALPTPSPSSPYRDEGQILPRNGGYSVEAVLAVIIIQMAVSICALKTGAHLAVGLEPVVPSLPLHSIKKYLDPSAVFLGFGIWIGAVIFTIFTPRLDWRSVALIPCCFAPLGTLARFYVSKYLNGKIKSFPFGTFTINIFGTLILGMCYDLQRATPVVGGLSRISLSCSMMYGVTQGFCGCATTVSTWVAELNGLRRRHAWLYGVTTVAVGYACLIVICGSLGWTHGFDKSCEA